MKSKAIEFAIMAIQSFADNSGCFEEALGEFEITEVDLFEVVNHLENIKGAKVRESYLILQEAINKKDPIPERIEHRKPCNAYTRNVTMTRKLQDIGAYVGCLK